MLNSTRISIAAAAILVGFQLVPVDRSNPAVEETVDAPAEVSAILERACYDCHSNTTRWPWYSYVAPVSWLVAHDVHEGRSELNFSTWNRLSERQQGKKIGKVWKEVDEGEMPLRIYRLAHGEAALSDADRAILREWAETAGTKPVGKDDGD